MAPRGGGTVTAKSTKKKRKKERKNKHERCSLCKQQQRGGGTVCILGAVDAEGEVLGHLAALHSLDTCPLESQSKLSNLGRVIKLGPEMNSIFDICVLDARERESRAKLID